MPRLLPVVFAALLVACGSPAPEAASQTRAAEDSVYTYRDPSPDGTGKVYMGREISHVMGHRGAAWLEREDRAATEEPDRVVEAMALEPGDVVADIGAGTGYFSFRIARRLDEGRVLAVDIQPEMLALIEARKEETGLANVDPILGAIDDTRLPPDGVDKALIVDAYHEFSHPREMAASIRRALRPGGRLYLVEYRAEDPTVPIKPLHKMTEAQARREWEAAGLTWVETLDFLPQQHILVFTILD